jgi:hypothetical protein
MLHFVEYPKIANAKLPRRQEIVCQLLPVPGWLIGLVSQLPFHLVQDDLLVMFTQGA